MKPRRPVCADSRAEEDGRVSAAGLVDGYRQPHLNVDVSALLPADGDCVLWCCSHCDLRWYDPSPPGDPAFYEQLQRHDWYYQGEKSEYI